MLVSTYHLSDTARTNARRQWIDARPLVIGRARSCHIVVEDPEVAEQHLRVTNDDAGILVENLAPIAVDVDGTPVAPGAALLVEEGRPIRIGGTIVKLRLQQTSVVTTAARPSTPLPSGPVVSMPSNPPRPLPPRNPPAPRPPPPRPRPHKPQLSADATEQTFLVALRDNPRDEETRMVYADWLEGNGFNAKAQLLRLREHLDTFMHRNATDLDWRAVAVRTPIDHCIQNKCPAYWDALAALSGTDFVRACDVCRRNVRYCGERAEVATAGWEGSPVVFDAGLDRVAAHATYRDPTAPIDDESDEVDDDPDGYTLDSPSNNFRR